MAESVCQQALLLSTPEQNPPVNYGNNFLRQQLANSVTQIPPISNIQFHRKPSTVLPMKRSM